MNGHCDGLWRFPAMYYTYRQCSSWRMFPLKEHVYNCVYIYIYIWIYIYIHNHRVIFGNFLFGCPTYGKIPVFHPPPCLRHGPREWRRWRRWRRKTSTSPLIFRAKSSSDAQQRIWLIWLIWWEFSRFHGVFMRISWGFHDFLVI